MPLYTHEDIEALHAEVIAFRSGRKRRIPDELADIDFKVLKDAVRFLRLPADADEPDDYRRRTVDDKMRHNSLTDESREIIDAALCYSEEVRKFIVRHAVDDGDETFPYRLTTFFKGIYAEYYNNGVRGDDLFDKLVIETEKLIEKRSARKAACAILVHLFEICEVFEK